VARAMTMPIFRGDAIDRRWVFVAAFGAANTFVAGNFRRGARPLAQDVVLVLERLIEVLFDLAGARAKRPASSSKLA